MLSVLGALAGGALFQWLFGFRFSVAVWFGYTACFGMAVETQIVMLVYLREAITDVVVWNKSVPFTRFAKQYWKVPSTV